MCAAKDVKQSQKSLASNQTSFVEQQNNNLDPRRNNDSNHSPRPSSNKGNNKQIVYSDH